MTVVALPFKPIDVGPIEIRTLRPVEEDLIRHEIALGSGVLKTKAAKFAQEVRAIAGRAGEDPYALRILTEAERIGGNNAAASQAVDRWLAARPGDGLAMMHKGELQIEALRAARSTDKAAWRAARKLILDGNKAAPNNPQILAAYYNSFVAEGVMPPAGAQNGLYSALELVPQDEGLRYQLASDFEHRGMIQEAITIIKPAAMTLHSDEDDPKKKKRQQELREKYRAVGDDRTETARGMLARLEKKLGGGAPAAAAPAALQVQ